jgi:hypothetical protein
MENPKNMPSESGSKRKWHQPQLMVHGNIEKITHTSKISPGFDGVEITIQTTGVVITGS